MIAATALEHDLAIVTRNVKDFAGLGVAVFNHGTQCERELQEAVLQNLAQRRCGRAGSPWLDSFLARRGGWAAGDLGRV